MQLSRISLAINRVGASGPFAGSALNLDFTSGNNTLDSRITFTRASAATRTNASGVLETVAIDGPRFDYDPVTLQPKGLLIEEQRTNLLTYSEQFDNGAWTKALATVVPSNELAPNGVIGAQLLQETTSTGVHSIEQSAASVPINSKIALSVFLKPSGRTKIRINSGRSASVADGGLSQFSLVGAGVVESSSNQLASIINLVGGWYRCSIIAETNSIATGRFITISLVNDSGTNNYVGDGTSGIYIWGAQLEAGAFPTSYIPTTTAAATRAADVAVMTGSNFSSWYRQDEGTIFVEFMRSGDGIVAGGGGATPRVVNVDDGINSYQIRFNSTSTIEATSSAGIYIARAWYADAINKSALAYKADDSSFVVNASVASDATGSAAASMTNIKFGAATSGVSGFLNGHIRRIAYYPRRLSNSELQAITA